MYEKHNERTIYSDSLSQVRSPSHLVDTRCILILLIRVKLHLFASQMHRSATFVVSIMYQLRPAQPCDVDNQLVAAGSSGHRCSDVVEVAE